jgi:hypothetical protein
LLRKNHTLSPFFVFPVWLLLESHSKEISFMPKLAIQHIAHRGEAYFLPTTKAQQSGARQAWIANHDARPDSLQPMVKKPGHR